MTRNLGPYYLGLNLRTVKCIMVEKQTVERVSTPVFLLQWSIFIPFYRSFEFEFKVSGILSTFFLPSLVFS